MSRNEMGSHKRSRAEVITRSTARRCAARVELSSSECLSAGTAKASCLSLNASACCILSQRLPQLPGHGYRNRPRPLALHTCDLLFATGHQLFAGGGTTPVLEVHRDT